MKAPVVLLAISVLTYASFAFQSGTVPVESGGSKVSNGSGKATAAKGISTDGASGSKANFSAYHAGHGSRRSATHRQFAPVTRFTFQEQLELMTRGFPKTWKAR